MWFLIELLKLLHWALFFVQSAGSLLFPVKYLPAYLVWLALAVADWNDLDQKCWATVMQGKLKGKEVDGFLASSTGVEPELVDRLLYLAISLSIVISTIRLSRHYGFEVLPGNLTKGVTVFLVVASIWASMQ